MISAKLIEIKNLHSSFFTYRGEVKAVRGVSFSVNKGETVGIVGESGSGKSATALSMMKLLRPPGKIVAGEILFDGEDLAPKTAAEMQALRGNRLAMIFQDPMTSLNPSYRIGNQITECLTTHQKISKEEARERTLAMLKAVQIPAPEKRFNDYPHEFSGGMRQRVMIAMALICQPELLIADEPTTALDVTIQAQILRLMNQLKAELDSAVIMITHNLGVVAETCARVIVMYGGMIMEEGDTVAVFEHPRHPYTVGLLNSIPGADFTSKRRLIPIKGSPPDLLNPGDGCPFVSRCGQAMRICKERCPQYTDVGPGHRAMCWLLHEQAPRDRDCAGNLRKGTDR